MRTFARSPLRSRYLAIPFMLIGLGTVYAPAQASRNLSNYSWGISPDDGCPAGKFSGASHWSRWTDGCSTSLGAAAFAIFEVEVANLLRQENNPYADVDVEILDKYTTGPVVQYADLPGGHNLDVYQAVFEYQVTVNGQPGQITTERHDIRHRYYTTVNECRDEIGNPISVTTLSKLDQATDFERPNSLPLKRYYSSADVLPRFGMFGTNWNSTLDRGLLDHPSMNTYYLVRPDGDVYTVTFSPWGRIFWGADRFPGEIQETADGWTIQAPSADTEYYDHSGRLVRLVKAGRAYDIQWGGGRITQIDPSNGTRLTFTYNNQGYVRTASYADGTRIEYGYDGIGNLTDVDLVDDTGLVIGGYRYEYSDSRNPNALTVKRDHNGRVLARWEYDEIGRATASEGAAGTDRFEIDIPDSDSRSITGPNGGVTQYELVEINGAKSVARIDGPESADCVGPSNNFKYDNDGQVIAESNDRGFRVEYVRNERGLVVQADTFGSGTLVKRVSTQWHSKLRKRVRIQEGDRVTSYSYNAQGRVTSRSVVDAVTGLSQTTHYAYSDSTAAGAQLLLSFDGPRRDVADMITYEYDAEGNRIRVTNALGQVVEITGHDAHGRPTEIVGPNGLITRLTYDAHGRLVARHTGGRATQFAYDADGNLARVSRPDGSYLAYAYDVAGRVTAIQDEDGDRVAYTLDAAGNRVEKHVSVASGMVVREHRRVFDALGRLIRYVGASNQTTRYTYDASGNRTQTTDPGGDMTRRAFDALGRLVRQTDALGGVTRYAYDAHDRITAVTDPNGNTTRYTYDGLGNRTRVESPDAGTTTYDHDAAGNVVAKTDARGSTTTYSYDALGRRTSANYADGTMVTYEWDTAPNGIGRLARIDESSGTTEWEYNAHGDVVIRRQTAGGVTLTTAHTYDAAGRRTATTYPSGTEITYRHDADAVTAVLVDGTVVLEDVNHAPFGPVSDWIWGDGDIHHRAFDRDGRLVGHAMPGGQRALAYSVDGNITSITGPNVARSYGYNALDRLTLASGDGLNQSYGYDATGNRLSRTDGGATESYTIATGSNRLQAISGAREVTYTYDAAGNMTADGVHRYTYDARGRLSAVDGGDTAVYRYNALGQRVYKRAGEALPDYVALAEEADERAEDLAAEADALQAQAQQAQTEAAAAEQQAAQARQERQQAEARAQHAEEAVARHNAAAERWQATSDRFAERAQRYRDRIDESGGWWVRLRNRLYHWLADLFEALADRFQVWANEVIERAEAAEERRVAAQADAEAARQRLAEAGQAAEVARAEAETLRRQATDTRQAAADAREQAAGYRRLAENLPAGSGVERRFVYDGQSRLIGVYGADGTRIREYVRLGRIPVAVVDVGGIHYVHTDHLGTPRAVSEPDGPVLWRWIADPFGVGQPDRDVDEDGRSYELGLRLPGQYFDQETNRHYNYYRSYGPEIGRFGESDPIGITDSLNTYEYAESGPILHTDPYGLYKWRGTITGIGAGLYGGAVRYRFTFTSECVNGERYTVRGIAGGPFLGAGAQFAATWDKVSAEDTRRRGELNPDDFRGYSTYFGVNARVNRGAGVSGGHFGSVHWSTKQGWGSDGSSGGVDISGFFGAGTSVVTDINREICCNE